MTIKESVLAIYPNATVMNYVLTHKTFYTCVDHGMILSYGFTSEAAAWKAALTYIKHCVVEKLEQ